MTFSIITPSFRNGASLKLCIASVADQAGVRLEHIVQDAGSDDGTQHWLPQDRRVKAYIERDSGMYDAINRGWKRATGDILAYINSDEQYLPGALQAVEAFFTANPEVDVVFSDAIVTDLQGKYLCHRYALVPDAYQMWVRFPVLTCSLYFRRRVTHELGIWFDTKWKDLGDFFWVLEMAKRGLNMRVLPMFTSVFADTGENMNLKPNGERERRIKWGMAPRWVRSLSFPLLLNYRLHLAFGRGSLFQKPFTYSLYTFESPQARVAMRADRPTSVWNRKVPKGALESKVV